MRDFWGQRQQKRTRPSDTNFTVTWKLQGRPIYRKINDLIYCTSSTAEGGGGSFKDRKSIGEVGCCEAWMAKQTHWWIQRWLECRAIYLSIHLSICLSIYLSTYLSIYLSFYRFNLFATCLSICLAIYLDICLTQGPMWQRRSFLSPSSKSAPRPSVFDLTLFAWKRAWHDNGVHFFDISTSKSGPKLPVFNTFDFWLGNTLRQSGSRPPLDFEMCFAPQRRALFQYLNLKRSDTDVFLTFCLWNALGTTTAYIVYLRIYIYILWTSQFPKVIKSAPNMVCLSLLISKRASRHNGVQFLISHLTRWLRTFRLSEPTFRPPGAAKTFEKQPFATFLPFCAPASSFFWLFLFSDFFCSSFLFSDSFHLCFSICPYCPKFDF